jgi:hypothetical protein
MCRIFLRFVVFVAALSFTSDGFFNVGQGLADNQSATNTEGLVPCVGHKSTLHDQTRNVMPLRNPSVQDRAGRLAPPFVSGRADGLAGLRGYASKQETTQTWTFLFYDDADFSNAYDPFTDFVADAHSDDNVNVLILQDTNNGPGRIWYVDRDHNAVLEADWGEPDMGNYMTLRDFILFGKTHYPADRYLLALYDHGGGWNGACADVTNEGWLQMYDIKRAVSPAGNVDIICFTAPCLMGAVESVYELRDCVDIYIGSEDLSGFAFWHGIMGDICGVLNDSSHLSNENVAEMIIQFVAANQYWPFEYMTMSATKASAVGGVVQQVNAFTQYAIANMWDTFDNVWRARNTAWGFGYGGMFEVEEIDLYDFAAQYAALNTDPLLAQILQDLMYNLDAAVVAECHNSGHLRANGLSIYFPDKRDDYNWWYSMVSLDFLMDTDWRAFLDLYLDYEVPVLLQHYASSWKGDHAEITWILKDSNLEAELSFEVMRRAGANGYFERITGPEIERNGSEYKFRDYTVKNGETYSYRVEVLEGDEVVTSFNTELKTPAHALTLYQNHPNPFTQGTNIEFVLPEDGYVVLEVFDISGKRVRVLANRTMPAGRHMELWDGRSGSGEYVASGMYFYRVATGEGVITKKCVMLR